MSQETRTKPAVNPFLIILAVTLLPMLLAYIVYQTGWGIPEDTVNQGGLLTPPVHVRELSMPETDLNLLLQQKRWLVFIPVVNPCEQSCQDRLFITRQVHIRLGEKSRRVQRYALSLAGEQSDAHLKVLREDHPQLKILSISPGAWSDWLAKTNVNQQAQNIFLLVDQEGYAMMYYTAEHTGNDLLKDIKRLLKYSYEE